MTWNKIAFFVFLYAVLISFVLASDSLELKILAEWKNIQFSFDSEAQRQFALDMGLYNKTIQKRPYDSDIYITKNGKWRKFISVPRISNGVPYTLMEVLSINTTDGPLVRAYPNVETHLNRSCDGIFSVLRFYIEDECHRLWVLDSGVDFFANPKLQICPPKIVAINLITDSIELTYVIPNDSLVGHYVPEVSVFNIITLLPSKSCKRTIGYATFTRGPGGLLVFSQDKNRFKSWVVTSDYFKADPRYYRTTMANESFNFSDGIYGVAPSNYQDVLYFHPFASLTEYSARLSLVNMEKLWSNDYNLECIFKPIGQRPTQAATEAVDSRGNLFFTLMDPILGIFCWNNKNPYNAANFKLVLENAEVFQFVAGLKIKQIRRIGEVIIGISNRAQKHNTGTVSPNEINYRMFLLPIDGVNCSKPYV